MFYLITHLVLGLVFGNDSYIKLRLRNETISVYIVKDLEYVGTSKWFILKLKVMKVSKQKGTSNGIK